MNARRAAAARKPVVTSFAAFDVQLGQAELPNTRPCVGHEEEDITAIEASEELEISGLAIGDGFDIER